LEADHLRQRVHTGIGPAGGVGDDTTPGQPLENCLEIPLHRPADSLPLPAGEASAGVLQDGKIGGPGHAQRKISGLTASSKQNKDLRGRTARGQLTAAPTLMTTGNPPLVTALRALAAGDRLGEARTRAAFAQIMEGQGAPEQVAALLMGLRVQGETADEIAGVVRALRDAMIAVPVAERDPLIDTCGTGGGTVSTFNISTAAAFVAVGAGAVVAKHGNRSYTSRCGSADLLEALGVEITVAADLASRLLRDVGMAFLFAPAFHPATGCVTPVRRALGVPTLMNLVGPLANPAGTARQIIGVWEVSRAPLVAEVLARLGAEHAMVVHARAGLDEISPAGLTDVWEVRDGRVHQWTVDPEEHGLDVADVGRLAGGDPPANAARVERVLTQPSRDPAARAAVALNAGAALYVAGVASSLAEGMALAVAALEDGAGRRALDRLRGEAALSTSG
jgi:anthranilate phosphoribosyltransferase